jgi:hypothetical protein
VAVFCVVYAAFVTAGGDLQQKERRRLAYEAKKARLAADPALAVHYWLCIMGRVDDESDC